MRDVREARITSVPLARDLHAICPDILCRLEHTRGSVLDLFTGKGMLYVVRLNCPRPETRVYYTCNANRYIQDYYFYMRFNTLKHRVSDWFRIGMFLLTFSKDR